MKAAQTLIAWNRSGKPEWSDRKDDVPLGSIAIGPLIPPDMPDWSDPYPLTGGASYVYRRKMHGPAQELEVMLEWYALVYSYGLDPYIVHRAFLLIDEYQAAIKSCGLGPDKDEPGHDPNIPYGRTATIEPPKLKIFRRGGATHFWPADRANSPRADSERAMAS